MTVEELTAYEVLEARKMPDLDSYCYLMRHKKSGARVALISNEDENKVFYIGFRTPPKDSTGVAHIIEHTVLCGSEKFPLKDPFIELAKGSLNTFLNAMTFPDKTLYPVASCNDQDFRNLCDVYLDAVFHPNIYHEEKIFKQEGWHYELNAPEEDITLNGVVYSEMKGAFSSPDSVFERSVMNSLFPDTSYGVESGGDPDNIPDLTYEEYLDFHRRYYHPSNSYIYLYGNMDMAETLNWMDEEYLSKYEKIEVDSELTLQKPFDAPKEVTVEYPITADESEEDKTFLSYNICIGEVTDAVDFVTWGLLDLVLCSKQGAPIKEALIKAGIGQDVYSVCETGIRQGYFSIVAKDAKTSQKDEFVRIIEHELERVAKEGVSKRALEGALNYQEFRHREADFGSQPKGLIYGIAALDSWLYDDAKPFTNVESNEAYRILRERIGTDYFQSVIRTSLIENTHKTVLVCKPGKGITESREEELKAKLAAYKKSLSTEELQQLVEDTKALKAYQEEPTSEENLKKIPLLRREDLKQKTDPFSNEEYRVGDAVLVHHDVFTNGIQYFNINFDITDMPMEYFRYAGILNAAIGSMNTEHYTYEELEDEIGIHMGGLLVHYADYCADNDLDQYHLCVRVRGKMFANKTADGIRLVRELMSTKFEDKARLKEILVENVSGLKQAMMSLGHIIAAGRAQMNFSVLENLREMNSGLEYYYFLCDLVEHYEERADELIATLNKIRAYILRKENVLFDLTCPKADVDSFITEAKNFYDDLSDEKGTGVRLYVEPKKRKEAFTIAGQIQYVAKAGNFCAHGLSYHPLIPLLRVILGYDYLWNQVRVLGGAYGCMTRFEQNGSAYFVSYRDPNLRNTIEVFDKAPEYIRNLDLDERELTKYLIGAFSNIDMPLTPAKRGERDLNAYLTGMTLEKAQARRDALLHVTAEQVRELSKYLEAFLSDDCLCVVGNEGNIREAANLFDEIRPLVQ